MFFFSLSICDGIFDFFFLSLKITGLLGQFPAWVFYPMIIRCVTFVWNCVELHSMLVMDLCDISLHCDRTKWIFLLWAWWDLTISSIPWVMSLVNVIALMSRRSKLCVSYSVEGVDYQSFDWSHLWQVWVAGMRNVEKELKEIFLTYNYFDYLFLNHN